MTSSPCPLHKNILGIGPRLRIMLEVNFRERGKGEVRRTPLPRTPLHRGVLAFLGLLGSRPAPPLGALAHKYAPGEDVVQGVEVRDQGRRQVQLHNRPVILWSFASLRGEDRLSQRLVRLPEVVAGAGLRLAHPGSPHDALDLLPDLVAHQALPSSAARTPCATRPSVRPLERLGYTTGAVALLLSRLRFTKQLDSSLRDLVRRGTSREAGH